MLLGSKVAFITGGASGIGKAIVEKLASEGAVVYFVDRDAENGSILANRIPNANFIEADLADPIAIQSAVKQCLSSHHQIDILVNNAGVILPKSIEESVPEYGVMSAGSVLATIPLIIIFFVFQRWLVSGIMSGALKT